MLNRFSLLFGVASIATVMLAITLLLGAIAFDGAAAISWSFITDGLANAGREGGIWPVLLSTAWLMALCLAVTLPFGLAAAVLLAEFGHGRFASILRQVLDVLAGVPSIAFGLFGNALFCRYLGLGYSLLAGALTLSCMVLPYFVRTAEEAIRAVPNQQRQAAAALGFRYSSMLWKVILPLALPGVLVAAVLALARALAETAALVFTAGYATRTPESWLDSGRVLSVHIYDLAMNVTGGDKNAWGAALVLVVLIVLINTAVAATGRHWQRRWLGGGSRG